MRGRTIRVLIVLAWLVLTGWLVRYEAFPGWFAHTLPGYRGLLARGPMILDSWMRISFRDEPIGYSHTQMDTNEKDPSAQYVLNNRTVLHLNLLGEMQKITVSAEAALDALYELQRFSFGLHARRYAARIEGTRSGPREFRTRMTTGGQTRALKVEVPPDTVLYSPMLELSVSQLQPGRQVKIRTVDPLSMTPLDLVVRATGRETLRLPDGAVETTVLAMAFQGLETRAWMDSKGRIVRQETPFGWVLEACAPNDAMALESGRRAGQADVLRAMAVPVTGDLPDPRGATTLTVRLEGLSLPASRLATDRQSIVSESGGVVELVSRGETEPRTDDTPQPMPEAMRPYLAATAFVQADDPEIRARAADLTAGAADRVRQVLALYDFVCRKVEKRPTVSLPSAADVLREMQGDCNEHTYLFVALARAAGIPAQIRIGLLYNEGAFYYHAWPAVFVGAWWELDPTIGQTAVDAAHISLLEGELPNQLALLGMLGRLRAEIRGGEP